jgi:hypothetical protein
MCLGVITFPRPEKDLLVTIRTGNYGSLERVLNLANALFVELEQAQRKSGLPKKLTGRKSQNWSAIPICGIGAKRLNLVVY